MQRKKLNHYIKSKIRKKFPLEYDLLEQTTLHILKGIDKCYGDGNYT